jgi:hypothetical protein
MVTESEEVCRYCEGDEDEQCDRCTDYFTSCEECGAFGIPVDGDGMAAELCEECENPPAVIVARALSELLVDLEESYIPEISGNAKTRYLESLADAVHLLRVHAVPPSHPWAVK